MDGKKDSRIPIELFRDNMCVALRSWDENPAPVEQAGRARLKDFLALTETSFQCEVFLTYCLSSLPLNLEPVKYTSEIFDLVVQ